ncbi:MAG: methyltransferase MtaB domain-containing protein, partial [Acidobacteriota bacterium]
LAIHDLKDFIFGSAPKPVHCGAGLVIGGGRVVPEINFTLPPVDIRDETWAEVRRQYEEMIRSVLERAVELETPELLVEFETLPPMTDRPEWALEIAGLLAERMGEFHVKHGLRTALRLTPNDTREFERPPRMRSSTHWDHLFELFNRAGSCGADLLAVESTGGKEICDEALVEADLAKIVFSLGVLGARDMEFLWHHLVDECRSQHIVPSGDTACAFANTAMVLADRGMIPRVFAAIVRVASVPRSLVAYRVGATGPSKDCAYEGPYLKAIAGIPISMEGRTAACAHLSPLGNISQAVCDCWSNESVQNVQMLSGRAPRMCLEQLVYDCRLMNTVLSSPPAQARLLRDWLSDSDAPLDPQAWLLKPEVVLRVSEEIARFSDPYLQTKAAVGAGLQELQAAFCSGTLQLSERERPWLDRMFDEFSKLPETEDRLIERMLADASVAGRIVAAEYGIG